MKSCKHSESKELGKDSPSMHAHSENEIIWAEVDEFGVASSGCGALCESESVEGFGVGVGGA
jgi:hypothetical protein